MLRQGPADGAHIFEQDDVTTTQTVHPRGFLTGHFIVYLLRMDLIKEHMVRGLVQLMTPNIALIMSPFLVPGHHSVSGLALWIPFNWTSW